MFHTGSSSPLLSNLPRPNTSNIIPPPFARHCRDCTTITPATPRLVPAVEQHMWTPLITLLPLLSPNALELQPFHLTPNTALTTLAVWLTVKRFLSRSKFWSTRFLCPQSESADLPRSCMSLLLHVLNTVCSRPPRHLPLGKDHLTLSLQNVNK